MICPDINLLLYAVNEAFPQHAKAKQWWDGVLSASQPVRLGHIVVLGFIRLSTNRKVFVQPLSIEQATAIIDAWLAQPNVELIAPSASHWQLLKMMMRDGAAA